MTFWIALGIDLVIGFTFLFFFLVGIADGSVTSFNMSLWIATLTALTTLVVACLTLYVKNRHRVATGLALTLAVPGVLAGILFLVALVLNPRWN
jgi:ABC-type Fe3+ transport system permease subunit